MSDAVNAVLARQNYEKEARFRMTAQMVVGRVLQSHGPVDPEHADLDAHNIALQVAALLFQHVYDDDAELGRLKQERDIYRKLAEESLHLRPISPIVLTTPD